MIKTTACLLSILLILVVEPVRAQPLVIKQGQTLTESRRGFRSKLVARKAEVRPLPRPPETLFRLVRYDSPVGKLAAYLSPDPGDGKRHPAIVWITGGDCNSIGEVWDDAPRKNDQNATAYRKAGIIMMFPSLRGGNDNPGKREGFLGEVDDVASAAKYLAGQSYVDPDRIYLGGHSTGGTLAMLVAETGAGNFRHVFSFGPASDVDGYDAEFLPFDTANPREILLRSPGRWLDSARTPLLVLEGVESPGNVSSLRSMAQSSKNPAIRFLAVKGVNHFSILAPMNERIAAEILQDEGPTSTISFAEKKSSLAEK